MLSPSAYSTSSTRLSVTLDENGLTIRTARGIADHGTAHRAARGARVHHGPARALPLRDRRGGGLRRDQLLARRGCRRGRRRGPAAARWGRRAAGRSSPAAIGGGASTAAAAGVPVDGGQQE